MKAAFQACLSCVHRLGCTQQPDCSGSKWKLADGYVEAMTKRGSLPMANLSKPSSLCILEALRAMRYEKMGEVVLVRVQLSVKNCIRRIAGKQGVSGWIRGIILEELEQLAEATD